MPRSRRWRCVIFLPGFVCSSATSEDQRRQRKVIWIGPGWPLLTGPQINLSSKQTQSIFNSVVSLSTTLRQARITLYNVDPLSTADSGGPRMTYYEQFLKGVTGPNQVQLANLSLQVLATQTGGRVLYGNMYGNNSVVDGIERCGADLDSFYTLTIAVAPADHPNTYHKLDVNMVTKGLKARTLTGYYAQP